jgi:hypothetical protein
MVALSATLPAQSDPIRMLDRTIREAQVFREKASSATAVETLRQRSLVVPPHSRVAIGAAAADPLRPRYFAHEIVSEYSVAFLKGSSPLQLVEFRELVSKDGAPVATREKARHTLAQDVQAGEDHIRRRILQELTALGLVDVATDYGLILLAFTREAVGELEITPAGQGFVGAEESSCFHWRQTAGGALEFRGRKTAHLPMQGDLWIRRSDGVPLRISCWIEHPEGKRVLRDEGVVDYVPSGLGFLAPVTAAHRHFVDGQPLTENVYSYEAFHLFTTDTKIHYTGAPSPDAPKK